MGMVKRHIEKISGNKLGMDGLITVSLMDVLAHRGWEYLEEKPEHVLVDMLLCDCAIAPEHWTAVREAAERAVNNPGVSFANRPSIEGGLRALHDIATGRHVTETTMESSRVQNLVAKFARLVVCFYWHWSY